MEKNKKDKISSIPTKIDIIFKLLLVSYIERKKEMNDLCNTLKSMLQPIDMNEAMHDNSGITDTILGFNSAITTSILEIQETLIKNDENLSKMLETFKKYESENEDLYNDFNDSSIDVKLINSDNIDYNKLLEDLTKKYR